jgi:hypothetical protein
VKPEDAWDAAHLQGARQVDEFAKTVAREPGVAPEEAPRHADNAYVLFEYLANTYPKLPRDATERDVWLFLFDYYITQGPFSGKTAALLLRSIRLFFESIARRERVPEMEYIRHACGLEEFYAQRLATYEEVARASREPKVDAAQVESALADWWRELDMHMWERGLVPDAFLAGEEDRWSEEMGPMEAAAFDAVCSVLTRRARALRGERVARDVRDRELLAAQREFMRRRNPGLGMSPLEAILREREARKVESAREG